MNAKNIFGAICLAAALFFVWPSVFGSWAEMRALKAALQERQDILAQRDAILKEAAAQYAKYEEVKKGELATVFSSLIPTKKGTAELVSAASSIATTSGLQLLNIKVTESTSRKGKDPYGTMSISLELSGSYAGLKTFLRDLESYVRLLNVQKIEVSSSEGGTDMKFAIDALAYYIN